MSNVHFNIGGHYNTTTNVFTAPVAGKYYMSWSYRYKYGSGYMVLYLKKEGNSLNGWSCYPPQQSNAYDNGQAMTGVMDLDAGDEVQPKVSVNYAGGELSTMKWDVYLIG